MKFKISYGQRFFHHPWPNILYNTTEIEAWNENHAIFLFHKKYPRTNEYYYTFHSIKEVEDASISSI